MAKKTVSATVSAKATNKAPTTAQIKAARAALAVFARADGKFAESLAAFAAALVAAFGAERPKPAQVMTALFGLKADLTQANPDYTRVRRGIAAGWPKPANASHGNAGKKRSTKKTATRERAPADVTAAADAVIVAAIGGDESTAASSPATVAAALYRAHDTRFCRALIEALARLVNP